MARPPESVRVENLESGTGDGEITLSGRTRGRILARSDRLSFPLTETEAYMGKIRFAIHEATPLGFNFEALLDNDLEDNIPRSATGARAEVEKQVAEQTADTKEKLGRTLQGIKYNLSKNAPVVDLYMPLTTVFNDTMQYDTPNLGVIGGSAFQAFSEGGVNLNAAMEGLLNGLSDIFGFIRGGLEGEAASLAALRAAKFVPSSGFQTAVSLGVQRTLNPNTRAAFKGVNLREFTFTFKMIANSAAEARVVEKIVHHFRREAYPEAINIGDFPVGYKFPNTFSIQFTHRGQESRLPKIERCYLRNVQTTYNSTGAAYHSDGQPNEVDLTLNFVEIRTLNRADIEAGY